MEVGSEEARQRAAGSGAAMAGGTDTRHGAVVMAHAGSAGTW